MPGAVEYLEEGGRKGDQNKVQRGDEKGELGERGFILEYLYH